MEHQVKKFRKRIPVRVHAQANVQALRKNGVQYSALIESVHFFLSDERRLFRVLKGGAIRKFNGIQLWSHMTTKLEERKMISLLRTINPKFVIWLEMKSQEVDPFIMRFKNIRRLNLHLQSESDPPGKAFNPATFENLYYARKLTSLTLSIPCRPTDEIKNCLEKLNKKKIECISIDSSKNSQEFEALIDLFVGQVANLSNLRSLNLYQSYFMTDCSSWDTFISNEIIQNLSLRGDFTLTMPYDLVGYLKNLRDLTVNPLFDDAASIELLSKSISQINALESFSVQFTDCGFSTIHSKHLDIDKEVGLLRDETLTAYEKLFISLQKHSPSLTNLKFCFHSSQESFLATLRPSYSTHLISLLHSCLNVRELEIRLFYSLEETFRLLNCLERLANLDFLFLHLPGDQSMLKSIFSGLDDVLPLLKKLQNLCIHLQESENDVILPLTKIISQSKGLKLVKIISAEINPELDQKQISKALKDMWNLRYIQFSMGDVPIEWFSKRDLIKIFSNKRRRVSFESARRSSRGIKGGEITQCLPK